MKLMELSNLQNRLSGVIAFPITPFKKDLSLDLEGLKQNLRELLKHSICAIVAAGGTGEMYSLTPEEHKQVITTTVGGAQASNHHDG